MIGDILYILPSSLSEIDKASQSPGFDRECGLQYLGKVGNVFSEIQVLKAIELCDKYKHLPIDNFTIHSIGVDIGFGSSNTAVVATEFLKEEAKIIGIYAQESEHGDPQAIVDLIFNLYAIWIRQHFHMGRRIEP